MRDRDRRIKALELLLEVGDTGCCRITAAEHRAYLDDFQAAIDRGEPAPPLYLHKGGCTRDGGDLCPEATEFRRLWEHRMARVAETTAGLFEEDLHEPDNH